jgi:2-polyprenyl-3-methyl-5-hydroxy-6-metoxy-1,4-benzoquinol methylase
VSNECELSKRIYADPIEVDRVEDCFFYHRMTLPGVGEVGEQWDLRSTIDAYLGNVDFTGMRVLDVGTASGFLTFEMEKRGAEVVSFDMLDGAQFDVVPHYALQRQLTEVRLQSRRLVQQLKNGYWFAHQRLRSKAKVYYGSVYDLPASLGHFDVVVFGMILSHLRDPFQALYSASRLCTKTVIVTNQTMHNAGPIGRFMPSAENRLSTAWWAFSDGLLGQMLGILGFEVKSMTRCTAQCLVHGHSPQQECTAIVAHRMAGTACVDEPALFSGAAA